MKRPRYPSDEARLKQRPHVKIHLSWPNHPRYGAAYDNRDLRAIVVGVWMVAGRAHASATDNRVSLSPAHVAEITACRRPDVALTWLRRAADVMGWSLQRNGDITVIDVRNFARKQGFYSAERGATPRDSAPSEEPKNQRTEREAAPPPTPPESADPEPWRPLLNALAKADGDLDEKSAWLEHEWPRLEAEAKEPDAKGRCRPVLSLALAWYRTYLRGPREFRDIGLRKRWSEEQRAKYGIDPDEEAAAYIAQRSHA